MSNNSLNDLLAWSVMWDISFILLPLVAGLNATLTGDIFLMLSGAFALAYGVTQQSKFIMPKIREKLGGLLK